MAEIKIYSKNNLFQKFEVLKTNRNKRYKYHEFLVEGVRSLNEAVRNGWKIKSFIFQKNNLSNWARDMIRNVRTEVNYCLTAGLMAELIPAPCTVKKRMTNPAAKSTVRTGTAPDKASRILTGAPIQDRTAATNVSRRETPNQPQATRT